MLFLWSCCIGQRRTAESSVSLRHTFVPLPGREAETEARYSLRPLRLHTPALSTFQSGISDVTAAAPSAVGAPEAQSVGAGMRGGCGSSRQALGPLSVIWGSGNQHSWGHLQIETADASVSSRKHPLSPTKPGPSRAAQ